eukprot:16364568-Heterocapsa_arctica.AAC.1
MAAPARGIDNLGDEDTKPMPTGASGSYMAPIQRSDICIAGTWKTRNWLMIGVSKPADPRWRLMSG